MNICFIGKDQRSKEFLLFFFSACHQLHVENFFDCFFLNNKIFEYSFILLSKGVGQYWRLFLSKVHVYQQI